MHIHPPNLLTFAVSDGSFKVTIMVYESNRYHDEAGKQKKNVTDVASERSSTPVSSKRPKLVRKTKSSIVSNNKKGTGEMKNNVADSEIIEMWDTIAASEGGQEVVRDVDDDIFIDDKGGDTFDCYGSDNKFSPSQAPQAEEGEDEIDQAFMIGRRKKKIETSPSEIAVQVEAVVAQLYVAVEEDAELNRQEKPAITKLRNLSLLTDIIPRKHLQEEFLDRGVLDALKAWLEPLPDGSIPNINVRAAVFKCLSDLTIDLKQSVRREQLKKSGIGRAVMFYYKYDQEIAANRRVAKELVDKWSRAIFKIGTRYEDLKNYEERRAYRRPPVRKPVSNVAAGASQDDDVFDIPELFQGQKSGPSSSRQRASIPEAIPMDFAVRPESKIDPDAVRTQAKQKAQEDHRAKLNKKLQRRKAPNNCRP